MTETEVEYSTGVMGETNAAEESTRNAKQAILQGAALQRASVNRSNTRM